MLKNLRVWWLRRRYTHLLSELTFQLYTLDRYDFARTTAKLDAIRGCLKRMGASL